MARVTVEDCVDRIPNRFELLMVAAQRARQLSSGAPLTVDRDNDKNPVIALREIADKTIDTEKVRETVIQGMRKHVEFDEPADEELDLLASEQELLSVVADMSAEPVIAAASAVADVATEEVGGEHAGEKQD